MKLPDHYQYEVIQIAKNYEEMEAYLDFLKKESSKNPFIMFLKKNPFATTKIKKASPYYIDSL